MFFANVESFRSIVDGDFQNNDGVVCGGNFGVPMPGLRDYGFGAQFGGSFGVYDLNGRISRPSTTASDVQQQIFMTVGHFPPGHREVPMNMGIGYDWMINDAYGVFATSAHLGQWRGQIGYCLERLQRNRLLDGTCAIAATARTSSFLGVAGFRAYRAHRPVQFLLAPQLRLGGR